MAITFEDLQNANKSITTKPIKGKEYAEVNQRIKAFRMLFPMGTIRTKLVHLENGMCIIKAYVYAEKGVLLGTGHAYEKEGSSFINETSFIENCETSAIGRALGMCGFGIDTSVCSAEELDNALLQQEANKPITETQIRSINSLAKKKGSDIQDICEYFKVGSLKNMTAADYGKCMAMLNAKGNKK